MLDRPGRVAPCLTRLKTLLVLREVVGWGFSIYRIKLSHLLLSPGRGREETFFPLGLPVRDWVAHCRTFKIKA